MKLKSLHRYCGLPDGPAVRFNYVPRVVSFYDRGEIKKGEILSFLVQISDKEAKNSYKDLTPVLR